MTPPTEDHPEILLASARAGDPVALGRLLELYRKFLRLKARIVMGRTLQLRLDPSDLVQETFLEAARDFADFGGSSEAELIAWLRQILTRNLTDHVRHNQAGKRDVRREESLEALMEQSWLDAEQALALSASTPSAQAGRREQAVLLADALEELPADYREVILLRNVEQLPFEQVAAQMGRSSGAVRMLWSRALEQLHRQLQEPP